MVKLTNLRVYLTHKLGSVWYMNNIQNKWTKLSMYVPDFLCIVCDVPADPEPGAAEF